MKNIKKMALLSLIIFALGFSAIAQDIVKELDLPKDYEQWPNVLIKEKKTGNNTVSYSFYAKKMKGSEWIELLTLGKINGEVFFSDFEFTNGEDNYNHSMLMPDNGNGYRIIHWAINEGYLRFDSRNFEEPTMEELKRLSDQEMEELMKRRLETSERFIKNSERLVEHKEKIKSLGLDLREVEDFLGQLEKDFFIFFENLVKS